MEKITILDKLLKSWVNLSSEKRLTYLTGAIIITLISVICFGYVHYEDMLTQYKIENTTMRNEYKNVVSNVTTRYDSIIANKEKETRICNQRFLNYMEKNEKELKEMLFKVNELKKEK